MRAMISNQAGKAVLLVILILGLGCHQSALSDRQSAELNQKRPIAQIDSVWLEQLTWMEVRDHIQQGTTRVLVPTGGIEQNGPYVALGKHNLILQACCERLARGLGKTLVAPIMKYVPEGTIDPPAGHMQYPGTLSLRPETFAAVLEDTARSLRSHGFREIVFLGDSGDSQSEMGKVAAELDALWPDCRVLHLTEFYDYPGIREWLRDQGLKESTPRYHEEIAFTAQVALVDPQAVRYEERTVGAPLVLNGVTFQSLKELQSLGEKIVEWRVEKCIRSIQVQEAEAIEGTAAPK